MKAVISVIAICFLGYMNASEVTNQASQRKSLVQMIQDAGENFGPYCSPEARENMNLLCSAALNPQRCRSNFGNPCCDGDVCLTEYQIQKMVDSMEKRRKKRDISGFVWGDPFFQWEKGVVINWAFHPDFAEADYEFVREAFTAVGEQTCTSYNEQTFSGSFVGLLIQNTSQGCWSRLGKTTELQQPINLESPGCINIGIIIHEIGHALGLIHEHEKANRTNYVSINFENIIDAAENQFEHLTDSENIGPYDYNSVMHYGPTDFNILNGFFLTPETETISPFRREFIYNLGQSGRLSIYDIQAIDRLYCTPGECPSDPGCLNHGIADPMDCSRCICRPIYSGDFCQNLASDPSGNCVFESGGERDLNPGETQNLVMIQHSNTVNVICVWNVTLTNPNYSFVVSSSMFGYFNPSCAGHWIEIRTDRNENFVERYCTGVNPIQNAVFDSKFILVSAEYFRQDGSVSEFTLTLTTDLNECMSGDNNCSMNANCTNTQGGFNCTCKEGFTGDGVMCEDPTATTQSTTMSTTEEPTTESTTMSTTEEPTTESTTMSTTEEPTTESTTMSTTEEPTTESTTMSTTEEPTTESTTMSTTEEPTTESTTMSTTEEPTTESTTMSTTEEPTTESTTMSTTEEPTTESTTMSTTEEPTTESTTMSTTEEPTTESTTMSTTEDPTTESTTMSTTEEPTTESTTMSTTEEPTTESTTMPTTEEPTTESTTISTTEEPTTESTTMSTTEEPTTESTTMSTTEEPTTESTTMSTTEDPTTESTTMSTTDEPTTESTAASTISSTEVSMTTTEIIVPTTTPQVLVALFLLRFQVDEMVFRDIIVDAVNRYCYNHAAICCRNPNIANANQDIIMAEDVTINSGRIRPFFAYLVNITIQENPLCNPPNRRQRRQIAMEFQLDPQVVVDAIMAEIDTVNMELADCCNSSIVEVTVESPANVSIDPPSPVNTTEVPDTTTSDDMIQPSILPPQEDNARRSRLLAIILGNVAGLIIVLLVILMTYLLIRRQRFIQNRKILAMNNPYYSYMGPTTMPVMRKPTMPLRWSNPNGLVPGAPLQICQMQNSSPVIWRPR